ncbi:MAG: phosphotransferase enzyme family protein [Thermomicrobiales bacterium]
MVRVEGAKERVAGAPRPKLGDLSADGLYYWDGDIWQWQRLWLVPDEVVDAVRRCFARPVTAVHFLAAGLLNQSWRIDADEGASILRTSRPERSRDQVAYEHALTRELNKHVDVVVPPLPGRDGETIQHWRGRILSLFPFVEGGSGVSMSADDRGRQTATVLAHFHRASLAHVGFGQRPGFRAVDEHPRWIWSAVKPVLRQDLDGTEDFDNLCRALDREIAVLDAWLDDLGASGRLVPRATVHGDFNPRNLIFRDNRLVAVIDWDDCRVEPIAWEVARAAFGETDIEPRAFWHAYLYAGGPLAPQDAELLGGFACIGALSELKWTVKNGKATPHAVEQVREVAVALTRFGNGR